MPDVTSAGVKFPLGADEPDFTALTELAQSVDSPADLAFTGKIRCLEPQDAQTFSSGTTLQQINDWQPHGGSASALGSTDQGDECGIVLETGGDIVRVTEEGFYFLYLNYPFVASSGGGIRRSALRDPDSGNYYQTRSIEAEPTVGFMGAHVSQIVLLEAGRRISTEAAQNSGSDLDGGNAVSRTLWLVAKLRLM